jgi:SPX domain protein involved in polyphosphate accumulation
VEVGDKELFKYGVLEVKLQAQFGQEPPKQGVLCHLRTVASTVIRGCAILLPNRVDLVPF